MKILMVCLGNICRSPLAEGIMQNLVNNEGLNWQVDSAGTSNYHINGAPDSRSIKVAAKHGLDITSLRGRQITVNDFSEFDHIIVMDRQNYADVIKLAKTEEQKAKVSLLVKDDIVIDPYYDDALFQPVFELIESNCVKLLAQLKNEMN